MSGLFRIIQGTTVLLLLLFQGIYCFWYVLASRLQKREDRMRSRADTSAGPANLKRESTIRSSNQTPREYFLAGASIKNRVVYSHGFSSIFFRYT